MGVIAVSKTDTMQTRREKNHRAVGTKYEQAVGYYLQQHGYEILQYNYRCPKGEIDLIAKDGDTLVFCEVKYRKGYAYGNPLEAVGAKKQRRIYQSALFYLMVHRLEQIPCRFDVIGVLGEKLVHQKDAFRIGL